MRLGTRQVRPPAPEDLPLALPDLSSQEIYAVKWRGGVVLAFRQIAHSTQIGSEFRR